MDRQQFNRATLGTTAATVGGPFAFTDLIAPTQSTPVPSVVGYAKICNAAQMLSSWDNIYGGGMIREAVMTQLRYCAELVNARCSEFVRADLVSAVGFFARVTGFMAFDAYAHDDARRMFRFALQCAKESGEWHLRAKVLSGMARQEIWCGDPDAGLTFEELARSRVMDQIQLASLVMVNGDPGEAAVIGGQALDTASIIRFRRVADDMRALCRFGEPPKRLTEVAELTHRIGSAVVV